MRKLLFAAACGLAMAYGAAAHAAGEQFAGTWVNVDGDTRGVTRLIIDAGPTAGVHAFGKCHPTDCDWGRVDAVSTAANMIVATYYQGFKEAVVMVRPAGDGQIQAEVVNHFTDNSGRPDYSETYIFRRQAVLNPGVVIPIPGLPLPQPLPIPLPAALVAPELVSPADGWHFDHFPRNATLRWSPVPGAVAYQVEVDCFHCCVSGQWCADVGRQWSVESTSDTHLSISFVGAQPGRWRVQAVGPAGLRGPMSEWREFVFLQ